MLTRAYLQRLAEQRLREAEVLLDAGLWSGAYYLAGYAVELGLKAVVAGRFKADEIPDRGFVNGIYTHNLATLITHAELKVALDAELTRDVGFARNWEHAKNWSEDARYQSWSEEQATALVGALNDRDSGVFRWTQAHW